MDTAKIDNTADSFMEALRRGLHSEYEWARKDPALADRFVARTGESLKAKRTWFIHDDPVMIAAWRAIGNKGRPTWKGLFALPWRC